MLWFCPMGKQPTIGSQGIVKRSRKDVFGGEAIVNEQTPHARGDSQTCDQITMRFERTKHIVSAVEIQQDAFCVGIRLTYPCGRNAIDVNRRYMRSFWQ